MDKQVEEIKKWLDSASKYELPAYSSLPSVPLYMEQVIQYVDDVLAPLSKADQKNLTSFMVNNYVKAGMIKEPTKKKYTVEHLGYLIAITILKQTLSMSELSLLIEMDGQLSNDKSILYGFFRVMAKDIMQGKAKTVKTKMDSYSARYLKEKKAKNQKADETLRDEVALTAFRLAVQSQVDQLIAHMLLAGVADDLHGPKERAIETTPGHKEAERERKISEAESKRIATAKALKAKEDLSKQKKKGKK